MDNQDDSVVESTSILINNISDVVLPTSQNDGCESKLVTPVTIIERDPRDSNSKSPPGTIKSVEVYRIWSYPD